MKLRANQFDAVYCENKRYLLLFVMKQFRLAYEDAEDVVQETFHKAFTKRSSFRGASSVRTWLHAIAFTTGLMYVRSLGNGRHTAAEVSLDALMLNKDGEVRHFELRSEAPDAERVVIAKERFERIAYSSLAAERPECFETLVNERGWQEAADDYGVSLMSMKSRMVRFRTRARKLVDAEAAQ